MKKLLVILAMAVAMMACSKDDDKEILNGNDPIIGTWYLYSLNGVKTNDCMKKSTMSFSKDKSAYGVAYSDESGECLLIETVKGSWKNEGDGEYSTFNDGEKTTNIFSFGAENKTFKYTAEGVEIVWKRK